MRFCAMRNAAMPIPGAGREVSSSESSEVGTASHQSRKLNEQLRLTPCDEVSALNVLADHGNRQSREDVIELAACIAQPGRGPSQRHAHCGHISDGRDVAAGAAAYDGFVPGVAPTSAGD
ncbi:hypothetical protein ABWH74_003276 [Burkholderia vietnamiensis]|uniref:hypothetical protein n=1 Tax=Burkholderia vietnamiensis TaxID=60552 RepID=UPI0010411707|nr:hypothetical protein [Burkholderia vietnamiensis]MCA7942928.1 hypothetical protein [Burkholderia vietnamiensis]MCA8193067.1 hypothetical protein [Burkholderia vietnamiensis]MDN7409826.1 hypothetical protein [Burkholderia vietnamiensis]MDN8110081.1 hypothetical protein [Burkholderia vietnamiensis]WHU94701.1 hypothetical protein P4G95_15945 [Burkholderia vietnamiensis]